MQLKSTQLRYLKANNPDQLTELVGALPFKIEFKEIIKNGKDYLLFFTISDEYARFDNQKIAELANGR